MRRQCPRKVVSIKTFNGKEEWCTVKQFLFKVQLQANDTAGLRAVRGK